MIIPITTSSTNSLMICNQTAIMHCPGATNTYSQHIFIMFRKLIQRCAVSYLGPTETSILMEKSSYFAYFDMQIRCNEANKNLPSSIARADHNDSLFQKTQMVTYLPHKSQKQTSAYHFHNL